MDATTAGPRPYDVHSVSRRTAQEILSARPLPDPLEEEEDAHSTLASHNRADTCEHFANSVREGDYSRVVRRLPDAPPGMVLVQDIVRGAQHTSRVSLGLREKSCSPSKSEPCSLRSLGIERVCSSISRCLCCPSTTLLHFIPFSYQIRLMN